MEKKVDKLAYLQTVTSNTTKLLTNLGYKVLLAQTNGNQRQCIVRDQENWVVVLRWKYQPTSMR